MAESNDGQERTEQPTPKRLQEAKEKGQVPRSRELNTTLVLMAGALGLMSFGEYIGGGLRTLMADTFVLSRNQIFEKEFMLEQFGGALVDAFALILPIIIIILIVIFFTPMFSGGYTFSTKALAPKLSKLNPISGFKRMFSLNGLVELLKAMVKVILIGAVAVYLIWSLFNELMGLGSLDYKVAFTRAIEVVGWCFLAMSASMILVAAVDVPYQIWNHNRQQRMTRQEVKDERKNTEGNPEMKGQLRKMQQEMAMRRMMSEVPKADVVVTNPSHYAVALKYDEKKMGAPVVVAKGADLVAKRIREIAEENEVTLVSAPPLCRAIFFSTELNDEVPSGLYLAVAQVLAYVFQLKAAARQGYDKPEPPNDYPIPEQFRRDH